RFAKLCEVAVAEFGVSEGAESLRKNLRRAVTEGHYDEHGLGFALGDKVVEDHVSAAHGGPAAGVIAIAMQEVKHRIGLLAERVVTGRGIHVEVALVAYYSRFVEVMMDFAVRHVGNFPRQRS